MALDLGTEEIFEELQERAADEQELLLLGRDAPPTQAEPAEEAASHRSGTPAMEDVDEEELAQVQAVHAESALKKRAWTGTTVINARWYEKISKPMQVDKLSWDVNREFGQTRGVDESHVAVLVQSLTERPPTDCLRVTVWENQSDRKTYILAGQHLCRALLRVKDNRVKDGLPVERWMTHVLADVLKWDTPLDDRKLVSGSQNASSRIVRLTTVSETLRNMLSEQRGDQSVQDFVLKHVEQSGANIHDTNPVCNLSVYVCVMNERRARRSRIVTKVYTSPASHSIRRSGSGHQCTPS